MMYKNILKVFGILLAFSFLLGKVQAVPFQLGVVIEPGFEYNKVDLKKAFDEIPEAKHYLDEAFEGYNIPIMVQAIFLDAPIKPYFGLGYSYSDVWISHTIYDDEFDRDLGDDDKRLVGVDVKYGPRNHNIFLELGGNFMINPHYSIEALAGYSFSIFPKIGACGKIPSSLMGKETSLDGSIGVLDYFRKVYAGARFYYTIMDGIDLGLSINGFYGWLKAKNYPNPDGDKKLSAVLDSKTFMGFQTAISIRKRFDLMK